MESEIALDKLDENDINRLLDVQSYFRLIGVALPKSTEAILDRLLKDPLKNAVFSIFRPRPRYKT